jgi:beta-phosphoglucomutase-like phosphatase (HAD superfamily)
MASRFVTHTEAAGVIAALATEFVVVENPGYVHPAREIYPLAPKHTALARGITGVVMDMDGTTTTTEALCIHSLETMVRRISDRESLMRWRGLDAARDYPHIIGNSTTKHVEYLVRTYQAEIQPEAYRRHYIRAAAWTLGHAADEGRRAEVAANLSAFGLGPMLNDTRFVSLCKSDDLDDPHSHATIRALAAEAASRMPVDDLNDVVRAAIDIYYHRYHEILSQLDAGAGDSLARAILGGGDRGIIEPMPGVAVFLALIKGWLGQDAAALAPRLERYLEKMKIDGYDGARLGPLGRYFETYPCRVAVVTSSIRYEARIVLAEVFRVIRQEIAAWPFPQGRLDSLAARFADFEAYYDAFITATDSSEMRLKPHRDLYSIALHRMGILPPEFDRVVGFEDSESGTIAIRASGIGACCAVPFPETHGHEFGAASYVAYGGLPEVMLKKGVFLPQDQLR